MSQNEQGVQIIDLKREPRDLEVQRLLGFLKKTVNFPDPATYYHPTSATLVTQSLQE